LTDGAPNSTSTILRDCSRQSARRADRIVLLHRFDSFNDRRVINASGEIAELNGRARVGRIRVDSDCLRQMTFPIRTRRFSFRRQIVDEDGVHLEFTP